MILIAILSTQSFDIVLCLFFFALNSFFFFLFHDIYTQLAFREAPVRGFEFIAILIIAA